MSIDDAKPEEWDRLMSKGPDKPEEVLMNNTVTRAKDIKKSIYKNTISGSLYHPNDHNLMDKQMFPKKDEADNVNHPPHYNKGGLEAIDYIQQQLDNGFSDYLEGNIIKYLHRYKYKHGVEDLKKAEWYLKKLIEEFTFNYG